MRSSLARYLTVVETPKPPRLFMVVLAAVALAGPPTLGDERSDQVDKIFAQWDKPDSPGCALGVISKGRMIYQRGYGMANLEYNIPNSPQTVFRIGSVSKQFTAMCVFLLADQGKLSLDDDIRKYLLELPDYGRPITVAHLIHHTSGIRDYLTLQSLAGRGGDFFYTTADTVALIARQQELNFPVGNEHLYSNSGYLLLGEIVNRASGKPMSEFARETIFEPLGMKSTQFYDDHTRIVKNRADGYSPRGEGYRINMTTLDLVGDGGVFTSLEDMFRWDQAFYDDNLGSEVMQRMHQTGVLNDGRALEYAGGLTVSRYRGLKTVGHGGSFVGFRAGILRFPEQQFTVICLANTSRINPSGLARQVADIYLADQFTQAPRGRGSRSGRRAGAVGRSEDGLRAFTGTYVSEDGRTFRRVLLAGRRLRLESVDGSVTLVAQGETAFRGSQGGTDLRVRFDELVEGRPRLMHITGDDGEPSIYKVFDFKPPTPEALAELAGAYHSEELEATRQLEVRNGVLAFADVDGERASMEPIIPDVFRNRGTTLRFIRDDGRQVVGFRLDAGRVRNLRFQKK